MPSYADTHDCILSVRHAGTKNFYGMLVYLGDECLYRRITYIILDTYSEVRRMFSRVHALIYSNTRYKDFEIILKEGYR